MMPSHAMNEMNYRWTINELDELNELDDLDELNELDELDELQFQCATLLGSEEGRKKGWEGVKDKGSQIAALLQLKM